MKCQAIVLFGLIINSYACAHSSAEKESNETTTNIEGLRK
jgi:hypothetical protein